MTSLLDLRAMIKDPKRSQRGSVLSGVLILVAFLAIVVGALMTELSTNLLLSRVLVHRVSTEATVDSAMELALDRFQNSPLAAGCPALGPVNLNGSTATVSYLSCAPVVDSRSPQYQQIASSSPFAVDGSRDILPAAGLDLYMVGDSQGNVYQFPFGGSSSIWSENLPGSVSGPPLVMPDVGDGGSEDIANLVPLSVPSNPPSGCDSGYCVALLSQDAGSGPDNSCFMPAMGAVTTEPAAGITNRDVAFFGDRSGYLFAYKATESGNCQVEATSAGSANEAIVAGPLVFAGPSNGGSKTDEIYVVTSSSSSSRLEHYTYTEKNGSPTLAEVSSVGLPAGNATGIAVDGTTLPARVAITFNDGHVALVQVQAGFGLQLLATTYLVTGGIADAPFWCHCPGSAQIIGVGGRNGSLYLLDTALNPVATYGGGASITTTPRSDMVGDWFFGAADGYVHEVQQLAAGTTMVQTAAFGPIGGSIASSIQVGACTAGICIYGATSDGTAFVIPLDARDALLTACLSSSPTSCSGANPRLWTRVEVGAANSPQTVHIQGWSYYSP